MPTTIDQNQWAAALENNMTEKFAYLPEQTSHMQVTKNKDVTIINSHCKTDMFNIICNTHTVDTQVLTEAIKVFRKEGLPFAWWTGFLSEPETLTSELKKLNLGHTERELGMAIELAKLPQKDPFQSLDIQRIDDMAKLADFIGVITELVPDDAEAIQQFYESTNQTILQTDCPLKLFVAYLNQKAVATSALFLHANVAGIWDIITLPEARHKGIGTDMTLTALNTGKNLGYSMGVLTASDEGQFVYSKLGFESLHEFSIYNLVSDLDIGT